MSNPRVPTTKTKINALKIISGWLGLHYFFNCSFEVNEVQSLIFVTFGQAKVNKDKKVLITYIVNLKTYSTKQNTSI